MIMNDKYSEKSIIFLKDDTHHITWVKAEVIKFRGIKREMNGIKITRAVDKK